MGSINFSLVVLWDSFEDSYKQLDPGLWDGVSTLSWSPNGNFLFAGMD
jgi:hypothetical protein